jgi:hypothetical protein
MTTVPIVTNGHQDAPATTTQLGDEASTNMKRGNDSRGGWIVQKFGGTSVGKFAVNIAEDIVRYDHSIPLSVAAEGYICGAKKQFSGRA